MINITSRFTTPRSAPLMEVRPRRLRVVVVQGDLQQAVPTKGPGIMDNQDSGKTANPKVLHPPKKKLEISSLPVGPRMEHLF